MKKIVFLTSVLILTACVSEEKTVVQEQVQPIAQETTKTEGPSEDLRAWIDTEKTAAERRDPLIAAMVYSTVFTYEKTNVCSVGYIPKTIKENDEDMIVYKLVTDPSVKIECFLKNPYSKEYEITSDECILARRNTKKSSICYYNYKKYLPEDSKIENDEDFLYLVKAYDTFYEKMASSSYFCDNQSEQTTAEKAECNKNVRKFLNQISSKTVPLCKNTVKNEYMNFLKDGVENYSFLRNMTQLEINASAKTPGAAYLLNGIYASEYERAWEESVQKFGLTHFCSVAGYQKDIANINKSGNKKSNKLTGLN